MSTQRIEILAQMKKVIIHQLDVQESAILEDAAFVDDLGADSLALVELVLAMEENFGITIPDTEADKLRTVGDAVSYVLQHGGVPKAGAA